MTISRLRDNLHGMRFLCPPYRSFSILLLIIGFSLGCSRGDISSGAGQVARGDAGAEVEGGEAEQLFESSLESGETPMGWILRREVERNTAHAIVSAITPHLKPSRFRTDDRLRLARGTGGEVLRFEVERRNRDCYIVERGDEGEWVGRLEAKVYRREVARFSGTIENSLWQSITERGASPELVVLFADIFAWTFDFLTDCREGDHFEFLVEALYDGDEFVDYGAILVARYDGKRGKVEGVRYRTNGGKPEYFASDGESLQKIFLRSPLNYRRISSGFTTARFHPILKKYRPHLGIDYAAAKGTPVVTIGDGVVVQKGWNGGFGNYVAVRHNGTYTTTYGHLSKYGNGIRQGVRVSQGQVIGYVGSTGLSTGPHLDFRMKRVGKFVNPLKIAVPSADPVPEKERRDFYQTSNFYLAALRVLPDGADRNDHGGIVPSLLASARSGLLPLAPAVGDQIAP